MLINIASVFENFTAEILKLVKGNHDEHKQDHESLKKAIDDLSTLIKNQQSTKNDDVLKAIEDFKSNVSDLQMSITTLQTGIDQLITVFSDNTTTQALVDMTTSLKEATDPLASLLGINSK